MIKEVIKLFHLFFTYLIPNMIVSGQSISQKCIDTFGCTLTKETHVFCVNINISVIPQCVENVEYLELSFNFLQRLRRIDFPINYFGHLEVLLLRNVCMKLIEEDALSNLSNLRYLDLSINLLKSFYPNTFASNTLLEHLNLSTNSIKKLPPNQFCLPKLKILDLSNGFLEYIDEAAFANLPALQWLNLRNNKLKTLPFEINVTQLLLGGNPWSCDCMFYLYSQRYDNSLAEDFKCTDVDRNRKLWNEIPPSDFNCDSLNDEQFRELKQGSKKMMTAFKFEKSSSSKTENSPRVIIDIYGYVLLGIGLLVFLCCCCDGRRSTRTSACELSRNLYDSTSKIPLDTGHFLSGTSVNTNTKCENHLLDSKGKGVVNASPPIIAVQNETLDHVDVLIHRTSEIKEKESR